MLGNTVVDVGHIYVAQLRYSLFVLIAQISSQRHKSQDAHNTHADQTAGQKMFYLILHFSVSLLKKFISVRLLSILPLN